MELRLFGELELAVGGDLIPLRGAKQRALIAVLALSGGTAVSADRLIDALWGDVPPGNPANALQAQVAQLRRVLPPDVLVTRAGGYALSLQPDQIDVFRFTALVDEARHHAEAGEAARASDAFTRALALCRGEALAEFAYSGFADTERARLQELELSAAEGRARAELALGHHEQQVATLEALCREHPLREGLWEALILALYRAGRQADALRAYSAVRGALVEELGVEPGPALRELESRILAQDEALAAPVPPSPTERVHARPVGNLAEPPNRLVGREAELDRLDAAMTRSRIVTVIGPGGAGKTRLACEAARARRDRYADGAWMVELAGLSQAAAVVPAVSAAVGAGQRGGGAGQTRVTGLDLLVEHVAPRSLLLVLDNCEHLIDSVARLVERMVGSCAGLHVIATSREPLAVAGEALVPLSGLGPDGAAELFVDRARSVRPDFAPAGTSAAVIEEMCARLDGLPLAIELAATRMRSLPLEALSSRLDDRFRLLTGGARTALPRHQTLRAVVDWSYDLLFEDERRLFAGLSVFVGGCELEAAEAVCGDDQLRPDEVVDLLGRLVDKSLVVLDPGPPARYSQLQTLREYARRRLDESGGTDRLRERHAAWYREMGEGARDGMRGRAGDEWRPRLEADLGNLRAALDHFVAQGHAESALRMTAGMAWLWFLRADSHDGQRWLADALAIDGPAPADIRGNAAAWHAYHLANVEGAPAAVDALRGAVAALRDAGATDLLAEGLMLLSEILNRLGHFDDALAALAEVPALLDDHADWGMATHDVLVAANLSALGRLDESEEAAHSGVNRFRAIGEPWFILEGLGLLAGIREARDDLAGAITAYEELLAAGRETQTTNYETMWLMRLAALRSRLGDDATAERLFGEAIGVSRRPGYTGMALIGRAAAARRLGDLTSARQWLDEALEVHARVGPAAVAAAYVGLAWWARAAGDLGAAEGFAAAAREHAGQSADPAMPLAAEAAALAVELARSPSPAARKRLAAVLDKRRSTAASRYARIIGGAFGAVLDEPDIAALAAEHGLTDAAASAPPQPGVSTEAHPRPHGQHRDPRPGDDNRRRGGEVVPQGAAGGRPGRGRPGAAPSGGV